MSDDEKKKLNVIEGKFKKDEDAEPKMVPASEVLSSGADMIASIEAEGIEAEVVVIVQMKNVPCIVMSNTDMLYLPALLDFAKQDVNTAIWNEYYVDEYEEDEDDPTFH